MCLSIPGKVVEARENFYIVDYDGEKRKVNLSLTDAKVGDYVIVSNKIIVVKVPEIDAKKFFDLLKS